MIFYIFGETYFLALKDAHGHIVGHTPQQLIAHLRTKYVKATQKQNEITILNPKYAFLSWWMIASLALRNRAVISDSAAEAITFFMIVS